MVNFDCYVVMPGCKHDIHVLATFTGLSYSFAYAANERRLSGPQSFNFVLARLRSSWWPVSRLVGNCIAYVEANEPSRGLANA
jgi:hypothetical protein